MKATELRIGNLILDLALSPVIVRGVTTKGIWISDSGVGTEFAFSPIPLTEEWLLRFGFIKKVMSFEFDIDLFGGGKRLVFSGDYLYLIDAEKQNTIPTDIITLWNKDVMKEFYVHQLQNLYFALTGKELHETTH